MSPRYAADRPARRVAYAVTSGVVALVVWLAWFAWDTVRAVDPVTGDETGPYEVWQGVGAAATLLVLVVVAVRWLSLVAVSLAVSVGFTVGFAWSGATDPESDGLYGVGAVMLFGVVFVGCVLVAGLTRLVLERRSQARPPVVER